MGIGDLILLSVAHVVEHLFDRPAKYHEVSPKSHAH